MKSLEPNKKNITEKRITLGNRILDGLGIFFMCFGCFVIADGFMILIFARLAGTFLVGAIGGLAFLYFGVCLRRKALDGNKANLNSVNKVQTSSPVINKEKPAATYNDETKYMITSKLTPFRPYMDEKGRAYVFTGLSDTEDFIKMNGYIFQRQEYARVNSTLMEMVLNADGFSGILTDGNFEERMEHPGTKLERTLYKALQRNRWPKKLTRSMLNEEEFEALRKQINELPLLVAFVYDNEEPMAPIYDGKLHMTQKAHDVFVNIEGSYYGIDKLCPGKEIVIIKQDEMIAYYGDKEMINNQTGNGVMHPRVAENPREHIKALAAYTNMEVLKKFFVNTRVALFTFEELCDHVKETDGMMIDLGTAGLCAYLDLDLVEDLANISLNSFNNSLN